MKILGGWGARSRGWLRGCLVVATTLTVLLGAVSATAKYGEFHDPDDADYEIDARTVTHADSQENVQYTLETWDDWAIANVKCQIRWDLEFEQQNETGTVRVVQEDGRLEARVYNRQGQVIGLPNPEVAVRKEDRKLFLTFPLDWLRQAGLGSGAYYDYRVIVDEPFTLGGCFGFEADEIPDASNDRIRHELGADPPDPLCDTNQAVCEQLTSLCEGIDVVCAALFEIFDDVCEVLYFLSPPVATIVCGPQI